MKKYDYIIIGAGMGGLSTANFLAKYDKNILVIEKHDKAGGCVTSFKRKNVQFDWRKPNFLYYYMALNLAMYNQVHICIPFESDIAKTLFHVFPYYENHHFSLLQ